MTHVLCWGAQKNHFGHIWNPFGNLEMYMTVLVVLVVAEFVLI